MCQARTHPQTPLDKYIVSVTSTRDVLEAQPKNSSPHASAEDEHLAFDSGIRHSSSLYPRGDLDGLIVSSVAQTTLLGGLSAQGAFRVAKCGVPSSPACDDEPQEPHPPNQVTVGDGISTSHSGKRPPCLVLTARILTILSTDSPRESAFFRSGRVH